MPVEILDHNAASRGEQTDDKPFLEDEIAACHAESEALTIEIAEIEKDSPLTEADECVTLIQTYAAIGHEHLSEADKADSKEKLKRIVALKPLCDAHNAKVRAWQTKAKAHNERQDRILDALKKRIALGESRDDARMLREVNSIAGLIS